MNTIDTIIKRINQIDKELTEAHENGYIKEANALLDERLELQQFVDLTWLAMQARS